MLFESSGEITEENDENEENIFEKAESIPYNKI